jgi:hypothetical protein
MIAMPSMKVSLLATILALALAPVAGAQGSNDRSDGVELAIGLGYSSQEDGDHGDVTMLGARYVHDFTERWGFEASYSQHDDFTYRYEEGRFADISARYTAWENERLALVLLLGGGIVSYKGNLELILHPGGIVVYDYEDDETSTAHVGAALEISLTDRLYLRPDVRYRRLFNFLELFDDSTTEASFAVGYRF